MEKLPVAYMRTVINRAWLALDLACQSSRECSGHVQDAYESELKAERGHRRFGHRFTDGRARYRLPPTFAARHFVMRHILDARPDMVVSDLEGVRDSVIMAYRAGVAMRNERTRRDGGTAFDCWLDVIVTPREETAGGSTIHLVSGTIIDAQRFYAKRGPLEPMAALLVNGRDNYDEPLDVPLLRGIDYARDFAC